MRRRGAGRAGLLAVSVLAVAVVAACGSADLPASVSSTTVATPTTLSPEELEAALDPTCVAGVEVEPGTSVQTVDVGGVPRSYLQYIPTSYEGVSMPVVVSLHNTGATAAQQDDTSGLRAAADADGFVLLSPQALGDVPAWDSASGSADVAFVEAMLEQSATRFCVDPARVFAFGNGDGSAFAGRLMCDLSDRVAASAFVGDVADPDPCDQQRPVPLVVLPGFEGGVGPWVERYGCDEVPSPEPVAAGATGTGTLTASVYLGCEEGAALETLPDAEQALLNDAIWAFLAAHPLPTTP